MQKSWNRREKVLANAGAAIMLAAAVLVLAFVYNQAHAFGLNTLLDFFSSVKSLAFSIKDKFDTIVSVIKDPSNLVDILFDGADNMLSAVFNHSVMIDVLDDLFSDSSRWFKAVENYGTEFFSAIRKVSIGIAAYGCIMAAAEEMINNPEAGERFFYHLMWFSFMAALINHCADLTRGLSNLGLRIVHMSRNFTDTRTQFKVSVLEQLKEAMGIGAGETIKALVLGIIGLLAVLLLSATVLQFIKIRLYMICIGILFEFAVRSMFMPLGIAWLPYDGIRGRSFHYIKGYVGVFMRVGICYVSAFFISAFTAVASNISSGVDLIVIMALWYTMPVLAQTSDAMVSNIIGN